MLNFKDLIKIQDNNNEPSYKKLLYDIIIFLKKWIEIILIKKTELTELNKYLDNISNDEIDISKLYTIAGYIKKTEKYLEKKYSIYISTYMLIYNILYSTNKETIDKVVNIYKKVINDDTNISKELFSIQKADKNNINIAPNKIINYFIDIYDKYVILKKDINIENIDNYIAVCENAKSEIGKINRNTKYILSIFLVYQLKNIVNINENKDDKIIKKILDISNIIINGEVEINIDSEKALKAFKEIYKNKLKNKLKNKSKVFYLKKRYTTELIKILDKLIPPDTKGGSFILPHGVLPKNIPIDLYNVKNNKQTIILHTFYCNSLDSLLEPTTVKNIENSLSSDKKI